MKDLTFQNATLTLMPMNGEVWVTATDLAKALGYEQLDILDSLHNGGEYVMERYRKVSTEYSESEQIASRCGKGLNHWRHEKPRLKAQLEYWQERQQLCLELN